MSERGPKRSIRRRLAAWYALFLLLTVFIIGALVAVLLQRELNDNVDTRLETTAESMIDQFGVTFRFGSPSLIVPPPDAFSFPSQLVQVVDSHGTVWFASENLGDRVLPGDSTVIDSKEPAYDTIEVDDAKVRVLTYPIVLRGQAVGAVIVGEPLIQLAQTLSDLRRLFILAAFVSAALAAISGWIIAGRALKPVDQMTSTARRIASGRSDAVPATTRLEVPATGDELARLAETFNDLLERLQESANVQRQFLADASHELRTPLTAMRGNIDLLRRQIGPELAEDVEADVTLRHLERETGRMNRLVEDLLTLARSDSPTGLPLKQDSMDLITTVRDALTTAAAAYPDRNFAVNGPESLPMTGDRDRLEQAMLIVMDNAARYAGIDGKVEITVAEQSDKGVVTVRDNGPGMSAEDLGHMFERFYRSDQARDRVTGGIGLGLAIARAIMEGHSGTIDASSREGEGTTVRLSVPLADSVAHES